MERPLNFAAAVVMSAVLGWFAAGPAGLCAEEIAARPAGDLDLPSNNAAGEKQIDDDSSPFSRWRTAESIEKVQRALADMGLYLGPIDGHLNEETRAAIRIYQQGAGMRVDGKVTRELWDLLNNAQRVRALLLRLEKARKSSRDAARKALLAHPATRDLVDQPNNERADPTRSADACFNTPTVRCLLAEASESVKAVFRPELRDWALGEILVAEARVGLTEGAMQTVRRIRDPRLIMVALRDIAEAKAASGRPAEALAAADIIPDHDKQADAFAAIASIQVQRKETLNARATIKRLLAIIEGLEPTLRRVQLLSRAAVVIAESGDAAWASKQVSTATAEARSKLAGLDQSAALHHVASALADMARPEEAIALLPEITTASERTSVLVTAAEAQMRSGDAAAALATADTIDSIRFKAAALGRIAQAQASGGERAHAVTTIDRQPTKPGLDVQRPRTRPRSCR